MPQTTKHSMTYTKSLSEIIQSHIMKERRVNALYQRTRLSSYKKKTKISESTL